MLTRVVSEELLLVRTRGHSIMSICAAFCLIYRQGQFLHMYVGVFAGMACSGIYESVKSITNLESPGNRILPAVRKPGETCETYSRAHYIATST
jgi:hypothetical protein